MASRREGSEEKIRKFLFTHRTGIMLFVAGIAVGLFLHSQAPAPLVTVKRANNADFVYTNPLLSCGISENKEFSEYKPLEKSINQFLENSDTSKVSTVSVYYRELNTGRWFGINENEVYSPASLFKVPIMIAYLKDAESNPGILEKKVLYSGNNTLTNADEYYKPEQILAKNKYYTVDELMGSMIKYSDNAATELLFKSMDQNSIAELITDIGVRLPPADASVGTIDFLTVKSYSYLFRLLYNSTYLSRTMSEKAMELLSHRDFPQGLSGGVPLDIPVAEKFGERTVYNSDGTIEKRELHDCGIVYYPKHPYLVCIMTKGSDFGALSTTIRTISTLIYQNVETQYKK